MLLLPLCEAPEDLAFPLEPPPRVLGRVPFPKLLHSNELADELTRAPRHVLESLQAAGQQSPEQHLRKGESTSVWRAVHA